MGIVQLKSATSSDIGMENSSLITLPPELIHRIFDYCDIPTILIHVRRVCRTLHAITNTYARFALTLNAMSASNMESVFHAIRAEQVISLTIVNSYWNNDKTKLFFSLISSQKFTRLRSLSINRIENKDLEHLLRNLSSDSLISLSFKSNKNYNQTWIIVVYALTQWNLRRLCMSNVNYMMEHISWPAQCGLEHLTIANCVYSKYLRILQQSPKLRTLVMEDCAVDENIVPFTPSQSTFHMTLKSLTMTGCSLTPEHLELLLAQIPAVHYLKLISDRNQFDSVFDASYWQQLICTKLPNLNRFEFFFSYGYGNNNDFINLEALIDPFRAPFWLEEKHWLVACAYIPELNAIGLYTTPIGMISNPKPVRYEISSIENTCRLTQRPLDQIVDNSSDEVCNKSIDKRIECFIFLTIILTPM